MIMSRFICLGVFPIGPEKFVVELIAYLSKSSDISVIMHLGSYIK